MHIGISSSCFYPLETEHALRRVGETGAKTAEIFFNTPSELHGALLRELQTIRDGYGMRIATVHALQSFTEGYWLFSEYRRRFTDALDFYGVLFDAAAALGADYVIFHGARTLVIEEADYAERFYLLNERAKQFGVQIAHENVVHYVGEQPDFLTRLRDHLGGDFRMVLDLKQAKRAGADPFDFLQSLGENIVHIHVSDSTAAKDCLPPGEGTFDFVRLKETLVRLGYDRTLMIELYRDNFAADVQLTNALHFLQNLF